jgi:hypothetical protein
MIRWPAMLGAIFAGVAAPLFALVSLIPIVRRRTILLRPAPTRTG